MENQNSVELLLRNIIDLINKLEQEVGHKDEKYSKDFESLREEISKLKVFLKYEEILDVLISNVSPHGLKKLLDDMELNNKFRESQEARTKEGDRWGDRAWKVGGPILALVLGVIWFFIKYVLSDGKLK